MTPRKLLSGGPVPTPCTSVCTIDQVTGYCAGCFRTLDEIAVWSVLDDEGKRAIWSALPIRRASAIRAGSSDRSRTGTDADR